MTTKKALIIGITGQIGVYLTEFLSARDYEVHGLIRSVESVDKCDYRDVYSEAHLHIGDVTDGCRIREIVASVRPNEIYHLAAQSHVSRSWEQPVEVVNVNLIGLVHVLEAIKDEGLTGHSRLLTAGSSEIFGRNQTLPISETHSIAPQTPYAISKAACYFAARTWRSKYEMFVVNAILFNHESRRRGRIFTTYKFAEAVVRVILKSQSHVEIGNLDYVRDWGHVSDGVSCMWLALNHDIADDYVVATGHGHTPRDFLQTAFKVLGVHVRWQGAGVDEKGIDAATNSIIVRVDPESHADPPNSQIGNSFKARTQLGWQSRMSFRDVVEEMVHAAYEREMNAPVSR
ncbi:GDP-mannose 4,6-dehydratase [Hypoxylon sp. FL1284]|nr:GDP-mannose 4,6-dehydratase [Hypoxylon sp. FL1284]